MHPVAFIYFGKVCLFIQLFCVEFKERFDDHFHFFDKWSSIKFSTFLIYLFAIFSPVVSRKVIGHK